jgi:hypothetical protein
MKVASVKLFPFQQKQDAVRSPQEAFSSQANR